VALSARYPGGKFLGCLKPDFQQRRKSDYGELSGGLGNSAVSTSKSLCEFRRLTICILDLRSSLLLRSHSCNFLPTFRENLSVTTSRIMKYSLTPKDGIDNLSRNVGSKLPLCAAQLSRRTFIAGSKFRVVKMSLITWWLKYTWLIGSIWLSGSRPPGPGGH
jgi:hypothetical protein